MGRKRTKGRDWLPPGVYEDAYGFFLKTPYRRLGKDMSKAEVWAKWEALTNPKEAGTLRWLVREYLKSDAFTKLSDKTRKESESALLRVVDTKTKTGTFGDAHLSAITPGVIRKYMDKREKPIAANREVSYLSSAFAWGFERDMCPGNPCKGVRKNPEKKRERYVTDEELQDAIKNTKGHMRLFIELAYLLAARKCEVLDLRRDDLLPEGVRVRRSKGSKTNIIMWSERLERAVNEALGIPSTIASFYLLHDNNGQPIKSSSLDTAWQRAGFPFTPHDLKRKGITDSKAANPAGHKDSRMTERYRVKPEEVEPPR